jgi:hypothetical protein
VPRFADSSILQVFMGFAAAQGIANPRLDTLDTGLQINATTTGYVTGTRSVFDTHYAFFAGAAVVEFICICLIAPTCKSPAHTKHARRSVSFCIGFRLVWIMC